jgi:hypothetical protein
VLPKLAPDGIVTDLLIEVTPAPKFGNPAMIVFEFCITNSVESNVLL